jgi:HD-like signal output (HDOD) protein
MHAQGSGGNLLFLEEIPTMPVFVQRLLKALQEENVTAEGLVRIIRQDPVISARLLRVANSAFFGLSHRVGTLERAIVILGTRFVQALALSVSLLDTLAYHRTAGHLPWDRFWIHSFACAWLCNRMVHEGIFSTVNEEAFTCGLLHDLGKPILWVHHAMAYQEILTKIHEEGLETHVAEKALLQVHHGEIGGELASWWKLPDDIQSAMRGHHDDECESPSTSIVKVADWIANWEGYSDGLNPNGAKTTLNPKTLAMVSPGTLADLGEALQEKNEELQDVVNLLHSV